MLPRHSRPAQQRATPPAHLRAVHVPSTPPHMVPTTVDWRGNGADSPVKDQAACGSCWVRSPAVASWSACSMHCQH